MRVASSDPSWSKTKKLLKDEGHMLEDKFLLMSRKGKRLGVIARSGRELRETDDLKSNIQVMCGGAKKARF